jgi:nitrite reductase (NO-forming)
MAKRFFSMTGIAVVVLIVLAACGAPSDEEAHPTVTRIASPINAPVVSPTPEEGAEPTSAPTEEAVGENGESTPDAGGAQEITVVGHDIYFEPAEVNAKAGKVTFVLPNEGAAPHDFSIDELDIHVAMPPGETQTIEAEIPAGTYEFYCNVPGHKDAGMVGTLVVE